jgi:hypothetical protein
MTSAVCQVTRSVEKAIATELLAAAAFRQMPASRMMTKREIIE